MKKTLLLLLFNFTLSFSQKIEIPIDNLNIDRNTDTLYLKKIDYFNYNKDNYLIDTLTVNNNIISFGKKGKQQFLFLISSSTNTPITYLPLRKNPEIYNYMFCSNFYKHDNYILLSDKFDKEEFKFMKAFYIFFSKKSFDRKLYLKNGDYRILKFEKAEKEINKAKKIFLKKLDKKTGILSNTFIEYIKTEIELGSINQLLNWYEVTHKKIINKEFLDLKKSTIHEKYYQYFLNKRWNINSIQYFRMVQRNLNYFESKRVGKMKIYHKETELMKIKKKEIIENTASNNVQKQ